MNPVIYRFIHIPPLFRHTSKVLLCDQVVKKKSKESRSESKKSEMD